MSMNIQMCAHTAVYQNNNSKHKIVLKIRLKHKIFFLIQVANKIIQA